MTAPITHGAWVATCPACRNCYILPGLPATQYSGGPVVRPGSFNTTIPCYCGQNIAVDQNSLCYITIATLGIRANSDRTFQMEQHYVGRTNELGPMTDQQLEAYLDSRTLVGVIPSQIISNLKRHHAIHTHMLISIVAPAVASANV